MDEATLTLAGLSVWIQRREFPDLHDYWDGNWLQIVAEVRASGANVRVQGAYIRVDELESFHVQLRRLYSQLVGEAKLEPMEPYLSVIVTAQARGRLAVTVNITPDQMTQSHQFEFGIDQSYLPATLGQLEEILSAHPLRGSPD